MVEWSFLSEKEYSDPFNEVEVSAQFDEPDGEVKVVPAFWAGGNVWRIRYASHKLGKHHFRTICSDKSNPDLHGQEGILEVIPYTGENPLLRHGPLKVSENRKHLEHIDGKPFFWLGDTWWMGLTRRLGWPEDFKSLTEDRVKKGFTLIQIVAGLYPDMPPFDPRGANEAGFPWEENYVRINPAYFDMADRRFDWLVRKGLVPCIVGSWGYFMEFAGEETMKKHWRNLVARYGAYPVVWCVAGEAIMPYYLSPVREDEKKLEEYIAKVRAGWTRVARHLRSIDPYHHPITIHCGSAHYGRDMVDDPSVIDIDMLQTGHGDLHSFPNTVNRVVGSIAMSPRMPVLVGEVCYEGILGASWENVQRLMFWTSVLNGAAGHTYGANGIWQVNTRKKPFGPSPHGQSWGDTPWDEAYQLPGSRQLGLGKGLLERYPWWRFESHPEWVEPHWSKENYYQPYAAGIPREIRMIYIPAPGRRLLKIKEIEPGITYHAFYFDPRNGREYDIGTAVPDEKGEWQPPKPPIIQDWVLVIEAKD
ncbi:MAG: DUF4038 domain-containing protein [Candidatus Bathyarchaeia archaeon]